MTRIVLVLNSNGVFESILTDSEIDVKILKRGTDDNEIDKQEAELELVEEI